MATGRISITYIIYSKMNALCLKYWFKIGNLLCDIVVMIHAHVYGGIIPFEGLPCSYSIVVSKQLTVYLYRGQGKDVM